MLTYNLIRTPRGGPKEAKILEMRKKVLELEHPSALTSVVNLALTYRSCPSCRIPADELDEAFLLGSAAEGQFHSVR